MPSKHLQTNHDPCLWELQPKKRHKPFNISCPKFLFHTVRIIKVVLWLVVLNGTRLRKWFYLAQYTGQVFLVELQEVTEAGKLNFCLQDLFFPPKTVCVDSSFSVFIELNTVYKCLTYQELNAPALACSTTLKHDKEQLQNNTDILSAQ